MSQKMTEAASVVPSASNSASSRRIESPNIGRRDVAQSLTEEDGRNMARVSPVSGSNRPDFRCSSDQHIEGEDQQVSDSNAVIVLSDCEMPVRGKSVFGACSSRKVAGPSIASADVIEVCDSSDDERMPSATSEASCGQRNKRNRAYNRQDSLVSKRKKCVVICDEENLPIGGKENTSSSLHPVVNKIAPPFSSDRSSLPRHEERSRVASNDSDDESCSESDLQAILETVQSKAQ